MKRALNDITNYSLPITTSSNGKIIQVTATSTGRLDPAWTLNAQNKQDWWILTAIQNAKQLLFERFVELPDEVISQILFHYDLKSILTLRLVSVGCYHLASKVNIFFPNHPLRKVAIPFHYCKIHPKILSSEQEKFEFAKNNTQVLVNISLEGLFDILNNKSPIILSIPGNHLKLMLDIENIEEIYQLDELLSSLTNYGEKIKFILNSLMIKIWTKLPEDCQSLIDFINTPNSQYILNRVEALEFGDIDEDSQGQIQELLNLLAKKADQLINLSSLVCADICKDATCTLPEELNILNSFSCEKIHPGATLAFPYSFDKLKTLSLGTICGRTTIQVSRHFNNLTSLTINKIKNNVFIRLPKPRKKIKTLTINKIGNRACLKLPKCFNSKMILKFSNIGDNAKIELPHAYYHQIKTFKEIGNNVAFILPTGTFYHHTNFLCSNADGRVSFI